MCLALNLCLIMMHIFHLSSDTTKLLCSHKQRERTSNKAINLALISSSFLQMKSQAILVEPCAIAQLLACQIHIEAQLQSILMSVMFLC